MDHILCKLLILFLASESADDFFIDASLQFASVTIYWNCSARRFCPIHPTPQYDFWRYLGGAKNFLGTLSFALFYVPLINYDIIRLLPQTP